MSSGRRNFGLDVLRAAAIAGVFLCHELDLRIAGANIFSALSSGVELFFVLSGFLIGGICFRMLRADEFSFWKFWRSRWWRTLPPYLAGIAFYVTVRSFEPSFQSLHIYYGIFLQNYLGITGFGPSWSLCVEEHFYLCLPIVVFLTARFAGIRALKYLLPALFFLPLLLRLETYWIQGSMPAQWYWMSHLHFEGLIAGAWLSYLSVFDRAAFDRIKKPSRWLLPIPVVMVVVLPYWDPQPQLVQLLIFTLYALGFGAWLRNIYDLQWLPVSRAGRLVHWCVSGMALCAYSIYLTHTTIDPWLRTSLMTVLPRGILRSLIVLSATWCAGVIFYLLVERPTIISRDRYLKKIKPPNAIALPPEEVDAV